MLGDRHEFVVLVDVDEKDTFIDVRALTRIAMPWDPPMNDEARHAHRRCPARPDVASAVQSHLLVRPDDVDATAQVDRIVDLHGRTRVSSQRRATDRTHSRRVDDHHFLVGISTMRAGHRRFAGLRGAARVHVLVRRVRSRDANGRGDHRLPTAAIAVVAIGRERRSRAQRLVTGGGRCRRWHQRVRRSFDERRRL